VTNGSAEIEKLVRSEYVPGFVTQIESETLPPGLSEDVVRAISERKHEPAWMTERRVEAYGHWLTMREPNWASIHHPPIDYQAISYCSAPKRNEGPKSLDEVDPELLDVGREIGVGEIAVAASQTREVEAQDGDPASSHRTADARGCGDILTAGKTVREQRIPRDQDPLLRRLQQTGEHLLVHVGELELYPSHVLKLPFTCLRIDRRGCLPCAVLPAQRAR